MDVRNSPSILHIFSEQCPTALFVFLTRTLHAISRPASSWETKHEKEEDNAG